MSDLKHPQVYAIDFGTSNSLLAAADAGGTSPPIPLDPKAQDPSVFRSILFFSEDSHWFFGAEALERYVENGATGRFLRSIKRFLPAQNFEDTLVGSRRVRLEELIGIFLREMRTRANRHFDADVKRVLLGRPARFSDDLEIDRFAEQRMRRAAEIAGFEHIEFCPEPIAAAYDFRTGLTRETLILVADFGGGTSDYTVMRLHPSDDAACEVLSVGGVTLAGDALDGLIMRHKIARHFGAEVTYRVPFGSNVLNMPRPLLERLCSPAEICLLHKREILAFLRDIRSSSLGEDDRQVLDQLLCLIQDALAFQLFEKIEHAKCELSASEVALFEFFYPGIEITEKLLRAEVEASCQRVTDTILKRMDETLEVAGVRCEDIDFVCCTGGTAKVPAIARGIHERFPKQKLRELRSFHSVIQGLAERARLAE